MTTQDAVERAKAALIEASQNRTDQAERDADSEAVDLLTELLRTL